MCYFQRVKVWENDRKILEDERNQLREDLARLNDVTQHVRYNRM